MDADPTTAQPETPLKRCTKCGEEKPATAEFFYKKRAYKGGLSTECKKCESARGTAYRKANAEHVAARKAEYHAANRDKILARKAARYAANPEKIKARQASYRAANPDKVRARHASYRAANPDKQRAQYTAYYAAHADKIKLRHAAYYAAHPEQARAKIHRRRARNREVIATFTHTDWTRCLEYFGYCCAVCGRPRGLWHTIAQDHWIPLARGGGYAPENILPLCHGDGGCNNSKGTRDAHEWLVFKFGARKAARIERRVREYFDWVTAQSGASAA